MAICRQFVIQMKNSNLQGDLLKMITNENYNVDLANLPYEKKVCFCKRNVFR